MARLALIGLGVLTFFGIVVALLAPPQVSQGNSFPAPVVAAKKHASSPPPAVQPYDPTKCFGKGGRPGPRIYAADQTGVGFHFAGPALVNPPVHASDANFAVAELWYWLCVDPVNSAVFAAAFDGQDFPPIVLYNDQEWQGTLDYLRVAGDWTGESHPLKLEYRAMPRDWVTDYMVPHPVNGPPDVGYVTNPNGKDWYLGVYDWSTGGYVWVHVTCMQPIGPHAPPRYLHATGGQLGVALTPARTTSS